MQVIINIPDNLPEIRVNQIIEELEQKLQNEAKIISSQSKKREKVYAHLLNSDNSHLPSREELYKR